MERVLEREGDAEELEFETEEDERAFEAYRAKRMEELRGGGGAHRSFSGVLDIAADSFRREVTDAADDNLYVVVHLFRSELDHDLGFGVWDLGLRVEG